MDQVFLSFSLDEQPITRAVSSSHCQELLEQFPPNILCLVNGRSFDTSYKLQQYDTVTLHPKLCGGKGGFGSMLRAIGAQIEATTNNDACRDLSGKRLRDVKCEKLMKDWSEKKAHEKDDRKERKKQKLQNILERPARIKAEDNTYISEVRDSVNGKTIL
ncbi:splicing regulator SDE2-like [Bolinopsis microptera]|uniref:splicing regulator SDE2-like n=1 Tax=Bolinopsis microptera TaxID=2820187 RepID=UPI003079396F